MMCKICSVHALTTNNSADDRTAGRVAYFARHGVQIEKTASMEYVVCSIAGCGLPGHQDGPRRVCKMNCPSGMCSHACRLWQGCVGLKGAAWQVWRWIHMMASGSPIARCAAALVRCACHVVSERSARLGRIVPCLTPAVSCARAESTTYLICACRIIASAACQAQTKSCRRDRRRMCRPLLDGRARQACVTAAGGMQDLTSPAASAAARTERCT